MRNDAEWAIHTITDQAADWFVLHRDRALDEAEQLAFGRWLTASPNHVEEYLGVARLALDLPAAEADSTVSLTELLARARGRGGAKTMELPLPAPGQPATVPTGGHAGWWSLVGLAAGLVAVGVALLWWAPRWTAAEQLATQHGEQRSWTLADQSVIHLNTDTALSVRYSRASRHVEIERGQAYFEVAHAPERRFEVVAGSTTVTAVGTKFDVYCRGDSTLVTVVEGRVIVTVEGQSLPAVAGEQVDVVGGHWPPAVTAADMERNVAWLRHQIVFHRVPLADIAAEFNRYSKVPIGIDSLALRHMPISGVFAADDATSFVEFLRNLPGVTVEVSPEQIRVRAVSSTMPPAGGP
jgi:transmembrane sensor